MGSDIVIKKPAKKSFRVLAGICDKPKRLYATFFLSLVMQQIRLKSEKIVY